MSNDTSKSSGPWWHFGHVWMVIAGPAIVVVASCMTFYIAAKGMDPVLDEDYYQKGLQINKELAANPSSLAPAIQARNHAQTGVPADGKEAVKAP